MNNLRLRGIYPVRFLVAIFTEIGLNFKNVTQIIALNGIQICKRENLKNLLHKNVRLDSTELLKSKGPLNTSDIKIVRFICH